MPRLVAITGPIAAGKNTVADALARRLAQAGQSAVIADVDDIAAMVAPPGAGKTGLWPAAHLAHGALVGEWMRSRVDVVIAVGPFHTVEERAALAACLPDGAVTLRVIIDAPVSVTFPRALADPGRELSRDPGFHHRAHQRFRELLPTIPADLTFDSVELSAEQIADSIEQALHL